MPLAPDGALQHQRGLQQLDLLRLLRGSSGSNSHTTGTAVYLPVCRLCRGWVVNLCGVWGGNARVLVTKLKIRKRYGIDQTYRGTHAKGRGRRASGGGSITVTSCGTCSTCGRICGVLGSCRCRLGGSLRGSATSLSQWGRERYMSVCNGAMVSSRQRAHRRGRRFLCPFYPFLELRKALHPMWGNGTIVWKRHNRVWRVCASRGHHTAAVAMFFFCKTVKRARTFIFLLLTRGCRIWDSIRA